jgi:GNAT superfamily N-acetyltransferase
MKTEFRWHEYRVRRQGWRCTLVSRRREVALAIVFLDKGELWLEQIETFHGYRRLGYATALMKEIITNTPRKRRWIRLNVLPFGVPVGMDRDELRIFYAKFGFKVAPKTRNGLQLWQLDTWK